ncbi:hypothetical protein H9P43_000478 [Blastocladiella emersonii ATCC 22665]|nr:hypothetical protein H9P43_000478 [Blastocladiella emersonii ATCC 22665]
MLRTAVARRALATVASPSTPAPAPAPKKAGRQRYVMVNQHVITQANPTPAAPKPELRPLVNTAGSVADQAQHFLSPAERHFIYRMVPTAFQSPNWIKHIKTTLNMSATPGMIEIAPNTASIGRLLKSPLHAQAEIGQGPGAAKLAEEAEERLAMLRRILSLESASGEMVGHWNVQRAIELTSRRHNDTGSPEAQAAVLTVRINNLQRHLDTHRKDVHNKRGLTLLTSKREKVLKYLKRRNLQSYYETLYKLGL